jgi:hypothetical protein
VSPTHLSLSSRKPPQPSAHTRVPCDALHVACGCCSCVTVALSLSRRFRRLAVADATPTALSIASDGSAAFVGTASGHVHVVRTRADDGSRVADDDIIGHAIAAFEGVQGGVSVMPSVVRAPAPDTNPDTIPTTKKLQTDATVVSDASKPVVAGTGAAGATSATPAPAVAAAAASSKPAVPLSTTLGKKSIKGVGFSSGTDSKDDDDSALSGRDSKRGEAKKKKPVKLPPPAWPVLAADRGWLLACGAVGSVAGHSTAPATAIMSAGPPSAAAPGGGGGGGGGSSGGSAGVGLLRVFHVPSTISEFSEVRHLVNATLPAAIDSLEFSLDGRCGRHQALSCLPHAVSPDAL